MTSLLLALEDLHVHKIPAKELQETNIADWKETYLVWSIAWQVLQNVYQFWSRASRDFLLRDYRGSTHPSAMWSSWHRIGLLSRAPRIWHPAAFLLSHPSLVRKPNWYTSYNILLGNILIRRRTVRLRTKDAHRPSPDSDVAPESRGLRCNWTRRYD